MHWSVIVILNLIKIYPACVEQNVTVKTASYVFSMLAV